MVTSGLRIITGRPVAYEPKLLLPFLRPIWQATDYACGRRLVAMLPEWIPAYEQHERRMPGAVREKLLSASGRTLDRLLEPLRLQGAGRCLTRPGTLLRHQIPIRGSVWDDQNPGWMEVDTVALCGGSVAGEFVWMVDGVDYATAWVEVRAMWGRGQAGTLAALQDLEESLPFALLGLDSDNGGEFINHHVLSWLQKRARPVFMTRSRPYKKDDNAHVEQKNWTHVRKLLGWDRYDSLDAVETINDLYRNELRLWLNLYQPSVKLVKKTRVGSKLRRVYDAPQTPLERVASSPQANSARVAELKDLRKSLDPFRLAKIIDQKLERIYKLANRRLSPKPMKESQIMESRQGKGCGKAAPGKSNNRISPPLGNPAQPAGFPLSHSHDGDAPPPSVTSQMARQPRLRLHSRMA
jgi:hypothetical protein